MDWTKAKTILIIALIVTDIFLIATYGSKYNTEETRNEEALAAVLEGNNIYVDAQKIPRKHRSMPALSVEYKGVAEEDIAALIESTDIRAAGGSDEAYIEAASDFISYLGMQSEYISEAKVVRAQDDGSGDDSSETKADKSAEGGGDTVKVVFGCEVDKLKLDGSFMICTFTGEEITGFDSYWLEPGGFSAKKQETISAAAALIAYMSEKEGDEEVHISEIELVYWVNSASYDSMEAVTDTALPTWRITFASGKPAYVEAFKR